MGCFLFLLITVLLGRRILNSLFNYTLLNGPFAIHFYDRKSSCEPFKYITVEGDADEYFL